MRAILAMVLVVASVACRRDGEQVTETNPVPETQTAVRDEEKEYTLRILFSGLVALVPTDETSSPAGFWALVGNATNPASLPVEASREIHPHVGRIYVSEGSLVEPAEGFVPAQRRPCLLERGMELPGEGQWRSLALQSEDITLSDAPGVEQRLTVLRGPTEEEVVPGVFDFAADIQGLLVNILPDPNARKLREELRGDHYVGDLVSARLRLDRGFVSTAKFWPLTGNPSRIAQFTFSGLVASNEPRALAEAVAIDLKPRGPVRFQRSLRSSEGKAALPDLVIAGAGGSTVTIIFENDPEVCGGSDHDDFLFSYNLVNGPFPVEIQDSLPVPVAPMGQGQLDNGQCSPPRF